MKRSQHGHCVAGDVAKTSDKWYDNFLSLAPIFQGWRINNKNLVMFSFISISFSKKLALAGL